MIITKASNSMQLNLFFNVLHNVNFVRHFRTISRIVTIKIDLNELIYTVNMDT